MRIHLPNSAFLGNIDPFLRSFDNSDPEKLEISGNEKWISIHPVVLSMVGVLGLSVKPSEIQYKPFAAKSKHYIARMGLFYLLGMESDTNITEHEASGRFIPLTIIKRSEELTEAITEMIPLLHLKPKQAEPIRYIVSELVRNVLEHANAKEGAVLSAQYYKKSNSIKIGIADGGVGIKKTINESHRAETHLQAIRLALNPGITGTTRREGGTELNAGAGLFFIKSIAKVNRDLFMLYSGNAMYKLLKTGRKTKRIRLFADPFEDRHSIEEDLPLWNGTVVGIDLSLDSTEEFSTLLNLIRKIYVKSVKERKKARYRRPKFI